MDEQKKFAKGFRAQIRTLILIDLVLMGIGLAIALTFWNRICDAGLITCVKDANLSITVFFLLCFFRPFILTPALLFSLMAGNAFGPYQGALIAAAGATISTITFYIFGKILGSKIVNPWLSANLPQTLRFLRSQDWKIIFALRMLPVGPFDLFSFLFGLFDFRTRMVLFSSFFGYLPQAYILAKMADPNSSFLATIGQTIQTIVIAVIIPAIIFEYISRKKGSSMARRLKAMWVELNSEIAFNNQITRSHVHDPNKVPILLLYGFFSSRRALSILEHLLKKKGYEVFSFNLGGILGVFFTRSITDTASFIDYKIKRQIDRHNLSEIKIVAHSKGGIVAMWYLLKLGGSQYCKKLITMGTPFGGSIWTWAALVTPIGLLFRDVWQMRPGSELLKEMRSLPLPPDLMVYNFYSYKDRVAHGRRGIFQEGTPSPQIIPLPMHHVSHFDFLSRRDVGDEIANVLGSPYKDGCQPKTEDLNPTPEKNAA